MFHKAGPSLPCVTPLWFSEPGTNPQDHTCPGVSSRAPGGRASRDSASSGFTGSLRLRLSPLYAFAQAALTKYHTPCGLNNRNVLSPSFGGWKPTRPFSLACKWPSSCCLFMWSSPCAGASGALLCVLIVFLEGHQ